MTTDVQSTLGSLSSTRSTVARPARTPNSSSAACGVADDGPPCSPAAVAAGRPRWSASSTVVRFVGPCSPAGRHRPSCRPGGTRRSAIQDRPVAAVGEHHRGAPLPEGSGRPRSCDTGRSSVTDRRRPIGRRPRWPGRGRVRIRLPAAHAAYAQAAVDHRRRRLARARGDGADRAVGERDGDRPGRVGDQHLVRPPVRVAAAPPRSTPAARSGGRRPAATESARSSTTACLADRGDLEVAGRRMPAPRSRAGLRPATAGRPGRSCVTGRPPGPTRRRSGPSPAAVAKTVPWVGPPGRAAHRGWRPARQPGVDVDGADRAVAHPQSAVRPIGDRDGSRAQRRSTAASSGIATRAPKVTVAVSSTCSSCLSGRRPAPRRRCRPGPADVGRAAKQRGGIQLADAGVHPADEQPVVVHHPDRAVDRLGGNLRESGLLPGDDDAGDEHEGAHNGHRYAQGGPAAGRRRAALRAQQITHARLLDPRPRRFRRSANRTLARST